MLQIIFLVYIDDTQKNWSFIFQIASNIAQMEITLKRSQANVKKPKHLQKNVFILYSPRSVKIEPSSFQKTDTEIIFLLPQNSRGFVTSIFRGDEIIEFNRDQQKLWVEILNKSYEETIEIKKNNPLEFVVIEPFKNI